MSPDAKCPGWVAEDGQAIWQDTLNELQSRGMLARASIVQVATYCQTWAQYGRATQELAGSGFTEPVFNKEGDEVGDKLSSWYKVQQDALAKLRQFWSDWRLLPKDVRATDTDDSRRGTLRLLAGLQPPGTGDAAGSASAG